MSSKTLRDNKHLKTFNIGALRSEIGGKSRLPSKEERREIMGRYESMKKTLANLEAMSVKNPTDKDLANRVLRKKAEVKAFFEANPCIQDHIQWMKEHGAEMKAEAKRQASIQAQARSVVNQRRNSEPLELLRKQQEAKKKAEAETRRLEALARVKAQQEAEAKKKAEEAEAKKKAEAERLDGLVKALNKSLGGFGYRDCKEF